MIKAHIKLQQICLLTLPRQNCQTATKILTWSAFTYSKEQDVIVKYYAPNRNKV